MTLRARLVAPFAVLGVAGLGALLLLVTSPSVEPDETRSLVPAVRVIPATPRDVALTVRSQGTVVPRTESELVPEISGRVVWVSPALSSGGFFEADEPLLRIDRSDYRTALARAEASFARAESELAHARQELARRLDLASRDIASDADVDAAQRNARVGEAVLGEARAARDQARRDLQRTEMRAPFSGRVRDERVDVGQFVGRGDRVATLYGTQTVEVRLPVPDAELAFLDLPLWQPNGEGPTPGPAVTLRARFAGREHQWSGRVVRTEGEIDARTRMVNLIAQVEQPYARDDATDRPPLAVGLFVHAEVSGPLARGVLEVPRSALRGDELLVVDAEDRLTPRPAQVVRVERDRVLVRAETAPGDRVCVSSVPTVVRGMPVRPIEVSAEEAFGGESRS